MPVSMHQTPLQFSSAAQTGRQTRLDRMSNRAANLYEQSFDWDKMPRRQANWQRIQFYALAAALGIPAIIGGVGRAIARGLSGRSGNHGPE